MKIPLHKTHATSFFSSSMYTAFRICRKQPLVRFLSFSELGVNSQLVRKLDQLKIVEPTLIQKRVYHVLFS